MTAPTCPRCGTLLDPAGSCLTCHVDTVLGAYGFTSTRGEEILDAARDFLARFVAFPSPHALTAVTLWAAHTHLVEEFDSTPRLAVLSPEKQSGKSRTLEILELLCAGPEMLSDASSAFIFRRIAAGSVTVLLDECDAIWRRGKSADETHEALRSIVNAGHRKRATVGRVEMVGQKAELRRYRVYAPAALAGIGNLPDTILDRAVIVHMRRRAPDERIEPYRERTSATAGDEIREGLADWCESVAARVGDPWPEMPEGVTDRPADVWEPLLAVADLAGGHWPADARAACAAFVKGTKDDTVSAGVRLLADLRTVFGDADVMSSAVILTRLHGLDESPWADIYGKPLDARGLANRLKPYGVNSRVVRIGDATPRGYRREDLYDVWRRYLPTDGATPATPATSLASTVADVAPVAHTQAALDECPEGRSTHLG